MQKTKIVEVKEIKAHKSHVCEHCGGVIFSGEKYTFITSIKTQFKRPKKQIKSIKLHNKCKESYILNLGE